jgi:hypothetical protein
MNRLKDIIHNLYVGEAMKRQQILLLVLLFACLIFLAACQGEKVDLEKDKNPSSQNHVVVIGSEIEGDLFSQGCHGRRAFGDYFGSKGKTGRPAHSRSNAVFG